MKNTRHVTLFALQASDAHSYIAEKRSSPLSCNPIPPSILGCSRRKNFWTGFFSSIYCTSFLISFNQRNTTGAVSPQLCFFFLSLSFSHEYIFWVKHFQFLLVIFSHLIQGGIWNTQICLGSSPCLMLFPFALPLSAVIDCGFSITPKCFTFTYTRRKKNATRQTRARARGGGAYPSPPALTPLARCHLLKPHPPPAPFSLEPHTETRHRKGTRFAAFSSALLSQASLICTKRQPWW